MSYDNLLHAHRHALHAWEDFKALESRISYSKGMMDLYGEALHSISHHLRHAVYRTGQELNRQDRHYVERAA